jgi:hypothetical protein
MNNTLSLYLTAGGFVLMGVLIGWAGIGMPATLRGDGGDAHRSWLLRRLALETEILIGTVLWGLAGLGLVIAGVGLGLAQPWWQYGAWLGAPLTIAAVALWFGVVPAGAYVAGVFAALTIGALGYYLFK